MVERIRAACFFYRAAVLAAFLVVTGGCSGPMGAVPASDAFEPVSAPQPYTLGPGDELRIRFFHNPELDAEIPIRPDGRVSLALIGDVQAAGLEVPAFNAALIELYGEHLKLPEITVMVTAFNSQQVYVGGEVARPSVVALTQGMTARQAIIRSGGALGTGRLGNVLVLRDVGEAKPRVFKVDLDYGIGRETIETDLMLAPKDVVFVPRTYIAEVNNFVDEYLGRIVPRWLMFQFTYNVDGLDIGN